MIVKKHVDEGMECLTSQIEHLSVRFICLDQIRSIYGDGDERVDWVHNI